MFEVSNEDLAAWADSVCADLPPMPESAIEAVAELFDEIDARTARHTAARTAAAAASTSASTTSGLSAA